MTLYRVLALAIAAFPALLLVGVVMIPVVRDYADHDAANRATTRSRRWFWGHLLSGVAFAYGTVAACAVGLVLYQEGMLGWPWRGCCWPRRVPGCRRSGWAPTELVHWRYGERAIRHVPSSTAAVAGSPGRSSRDQSSSGWGRLCW